MSARSAKTHARAMAVLAAVKADERDKQNWAREVSEAQILAEIMARCGARSDCWIWRQNTGAGKFGDGRFVRYGVPGQADIMGLIYGRPAIPFAIEVKTNIGVLSDKQITWRNKWENSGGLYLLARSADEVVTWLDGLARGP